MSDDADTDTIHTQECGEYGVQVRLGSPYRAAFRIVGRFGAESDGTPLWGESEHFSADLADWSLPADVDGSVKIDGCSNWGHADDCLVHCCDGPRQVRELAAALEAAHVLAAKLMGVAPWPDADPCA